MFSSRFSAQYFNPRKWASNGPRLLSASLASICDLSPEKFAQSLSLGPGKRTKKSTVENMDQV